MFKGGGYGPGILPDRGGYNDQCAWLMDVIGEMAAVETELFGDS